jgi:hypothetical protein
MLSVPAVAAAGGAREQALGVLILGVVSLPGTMALPGEA